MIIIGIDPGKDGFIAILTDGGNPEFHPTPTIKISKGGKRAYDTTEMKSILESADPDMVVLEKQQAMPGQGVSSMFQIGLGFGLWQGIVIGLGFKIMIPHPRTWQKVMHRDIPGDDTKGRSILAAQRLFPDVDLRKSERARKPHDGKADSLLLAEYGRRDQQQGG